MTHGGTCKLTLYWLACWQLPAFISPLRSQTPDHVTAHGHRRWRPLIHAHSWTNEHTTTTPHKFYELIDMIEYGQFSPACITYLQPCRLLSLCTTHHTQLSANKDGADAMHDRWLNRIHGASRCFLILVWCSQYSSGSISEVYRRENIQQINGAYNSAYGQWTPFRYIKGIFRGIRSPAYACYIMPWYSCYTPCRILW